MKYHIFICIVAIFGLISCNNSVQSPEKTNKLPNIYPDYIGVTIPSTIAPLDFDMRYVDYERIDVNIHGNKKGELHFNGSSIDFDKDEWSELLKENINDSLSVLVSIRQDGKWKEFLPFKIYVSKYPIDYGLVYRKIAPGYEIYSKMGIYERNLSSFDEKALIENTAVPGMCINCHSFNKSDNNYMSMHIRGKHGATLMRVNGKEELLNTKTDSTLSACVYPYWHPSGKYIAYSLNNTRQAFHVINKERIEVFDNASDVVVYKPETHEILRSPLLQKEHSFETFPVFSPDGRTLYFCSANEKAIPKDYKEIKYSLCKISFNPENGEFGNKIDTLISSKKTGKSISFPRPSYDGKYIMFTLSDYGNFSIWHKEADLWIYSIKDGTCKPIKEVNSKDTESFHNWSSNSHWFVFSSRRDDGLHTRLYIASVDKNGKIGKPFMLPQEDPYNYYNNLFLSYNVPEFVSSSTEIDYKSLSKKILSDERVQVKVSR